MIDFFQKKCTFYLNEKWANSSASVTVKVLSIAQEQRQPLPSSRQDSAKILRSLKSLQSYLRSLFSIMHYTNKIEESGGSAKSSYHFPPFCQID